MSNRPRRRPRQRVNRQQLEAGALLSARLRGCVCQPDLKLIHDAAGPIIRVAHDRWCPAHDTGRHIHKNKCEGGCNRRCVARSTPGQYRAAVTLDDAVDEAARLHWIELNGDRFLPGTARPA